MDSKGGTLSGRRRGHSCDMSFHYRRPRTLWSLRASRWRTAKGREAARMTLSVRRRVESALGIGCLAFVTVGCSPTTSGSKPPVRQTPNALRASVNGVPLLDLAKRALGAAEAYSVSKPTNVRAVVTTQAALYEQVPVAGGAAKPEIAVTLRGRFSCGYCGTAMPTSTASTDLSTVHISTMVLQLPIPLVPGATTGVAVGVGTPALAKLGHIYDLDPYIASLAGVPVPIGPVPG